MSWKFAGITFEKNYQGHYPELLAQLGFDYHQSASGFYFSDAITRTNQALALGIVNQKTLLLHHFFPYDCSYEKSDNTQLDNILLKLSKEGEIMAYIVDGISGTYAFIYFSKGKRIRRRAVEPDHILYNEGEVLLIESKSKPQIPDDSLHELFLMTEDEAYFFNVWENFLAISFQEILQNEEIVFDFFL